MEEEEKAKADKANKSDKSTRLSVFKGEAEAAIQNKSTLAWLAWRRTEPTKR